MQFRGTGKVVAKVLYDYGPEELERKVEKYGEDYDIIDLQYSTHGCADGLNMWSVFMLLRKKENKSLWQRLWQ